VYGYAAGRSLYGPVFPDSSLSLGWTAITVQWLSAMPCVVPDHVYANLTRGPAREALRAQSRRDWETFLRERLRELRPGGQVVVVGGASRSDGLSEAEGLFTMVNEQLLEIVADGRLRRSEYEKIFYPTWNRTVHEFLEPFQDGTFAGAPASRSTSSMSPPMPRPIRSTSATATPPHSPRLTSPSSRRSPRRRSSAGSSPTVRTPSARRSRTPSTTG
jgi:hypothetical protein